ncbi:MAG TPA: Nramp family divalent metal transporter [Vicinamibacteria bacterium]|nr:Nramp family divalent metal transporter [Vicinamibacteria bacterium]
MSILIESGEAPRPKAAAASLSKLVGPGLIVAATGIGAGDIVSATVGGARFGESLAWCIVLGAAFKYLLNEGVARIQLATGLTALESWARFLPWWVRAYFGAYLVVWTVAVSAALANACGLGIATLTGGFIPQSWGSVFHALAGAALVLLGGFSGFEKMMKVLIGMMFFSVVVCAALLFEDAPGLLRGLLLPGFAGGGAAYVLSLVGGIGGTVTLLSYNYWLREEKMVEPEYVGYVRRDLALGYGFTAAFGISVLMIASRAFHDAGIPITDAEAVPRMGEMLATLVGPVGFYVYAFGFWAAVFAALFGVWQSVPYIYADFYAIWKGAGPEERERLTRVTSVPYRIALAYVALTPIPLAFLGRPLFIIVTYTIVGSCFLPFLAATLLWLDRKINWPAKVPRNGRLGNALLLLLLAVFALVGFREIVTALS